jgi:hypothetical protein
VLCSLRKQPFSPNCTKLHPTAEILASVGTNIFGMRRVLKDVQNVCSVNKLQLVLFGLPAAQTPPPAHLPPPSQPIPSDIRIAGLSTIAPSRIRSQRIRANRPSKAREFLVLREALLVEIAWCCGLKCGG